MQSTALKSPRFSQPQLLGLIVLLATLVAFRNSLDGAWLFDDFEAIHNNASVHHLWPPWSALNPPQDTTVAGRPLLNLSFALNYAIHGTSPRGYHIVNLVIHAAAALTLFMLLRCTLTSPRVTESVRRNADVLAALAATLWAVHPLLTESVTYIVQRAESLCGLAYLITLYSFAQSATKPAHRAWSVVCIIACAAGMACKEVMVTAPIMVLVMDRALFSDSFRQAIARRTGLYSGLACSWVILGILLAGSPRSGTTGFSVTIEPLAYLRTEASVILHYLCLSFFPDPLILDYSWAISSSWAESLPAMLAIATILAGTVIIWTRRPIFALPVMAFFLPLAPTSSIYPMYEAAFEHRMYISLAPVMLAAVLAIHAISFRISKNSPRRALICTSTLCCVVAVVLVIRTVARNEQYADPVALWQANLIDGGFQNARAMTNLGGAFLADGRLREASDASLHAIKIVPNNAEAYVNLCVAATKLGEIDNAIWAGERSLEANAALPEAHFNLGLAYFAAGRRSEAEASLRKALALRPWSAEIQQGLQQLRGATSTPAGPFTPTQPIP